MGVVMLLCMGVVVYWCCCVWELLCRGVVVLLCMDVAVLLCSHVLILSVLTRHNDLKRGYIRNKSCYLDSEKIYLMLMINNI